MIKLFKNSLLYKILKYDFEKVVYVATLKVSITKSSLL